MAGNVVVYKYPLEVEAVARLELPLGAQVLSLAVQRDEPMLWALVDPFAPKVKRDVLCVGTGNEIVPRFLEGMEFVGTVLLREESLVLHYFLERESKTLEVEKKNARARRKEKDDDDGA